MVLPRSWIIALVKTASLCISKNLFETVLYFTSGFMLGVPNWLEDQKNIFCLELAEWLLIKSRAGIAGKGRVPVKGMFGVGPFALVFLNVIIFNLREE